MNGGTFYSAQHRLYHCCNGVHVPFPAVWICPHCGHWCDFRGQRRSRCIESPCFTIPNNLRKLMAEGALSSAFIPVLSKLPRTGSPTDPKDRAKHSILSGIGPDSGPDSFGGVCPSDRESSVGFPRTRKDSSSHETVPLDDPLSPAGKHLGCTDGSPECAPSLLCPGHHPYLVFPIRDLLSADLLETARDFFPWW